MSGEIIKPMHSRQRKNNNWSDQ